MDPRVRQGVKDLPAMFDAMGKYQQQADMWQGAFKTHFGFDPTNMTPEAVDAQVLKLKQLKDQAQQTMGQASQLMDWGKKVGPAFGLAALLGGGAALMRPRQQPQQIVQQAPQQKAPWTEYV
jgi:hypothetical protein